MSGSIHMESLQWFKKNKNKKEMFDTTTMFYVEN